MALKYEVREFDQCENNDLSKQFYFLLEVHLPRLSVRLFLYIYAHIQKYHCRYSVTLATTTLPPVHHPSADVDVGIARAEVSLDRNNLVVQLAQSQAQVAPGIEVVANVDRAAGAVVAAHRPVLVKGGRADDGRLVDALRAVNIVDAAVRRHLAQLGRARGRVVGAKVLDNVVLDERVLGPAVDGEVAVAVGVVAAGVVDGP